MRPSVVLVQGGKILGGKETHLQDPDLNKGNIQKIEWRNIKDLSKIRFYPQEIVPLLKRDSREGFGRGGLGVGRMHSRKYWF